MEQRAGALPGVLQQSVRALAAGAGRNLAHYQRLHSGGLGEAADEERGFAQLVYVVIGAQRVRDDARGRARVSVTDFNKPPAGGAAGLHADAEAGLGVGLE